MHTQADAASKSTNSVLVIFSREICMFWCVTEFRWRSANHTDRPTPRIPPQPATTPPSPHHSIQLPDELTNNK